MNVHTPGCRAVFALLLTLLSSAVAAQTYPSKQVKMIVPSAPGGVTDILARTVGQRLSDTWGQPVIVENRPGAGQIIGAEAVAKSSGDGYTLIVSDASTFVINPFLYGKLPYDPVKDFTPVVVLSQASPVLAVGASVPVSNLQELIALAKAKPGSLSYGSMGAGIYNHISMEQLKQLAGVDIVHVPYKGSTPALTDLLSGQIAVFLVNLSVVEPHAKSGKLKIIAAATAKRLALRPDLPTISESGFPGFESGTWFGILGPANLPRDVVAKIHADVTHILSAPEFREQNITKLGLETIAISPDQFAQLIRTDLERWGKLVKATGARVD
jgi:tripartite-type tricarboxylate transporter receptor subunit TctC